MTSKIRFLCDGKEGVRVSRHFWELSSPLNALFGALKPYHEATDTPFRPSLDPSRRNNYRLTTTLQLLTKKRSIFLSISDSRLVITQGNSKGSRPVEAAKVENFSIKGPMINGTNPSLRRGPSLSRHSLRRRRKTKDQRSNYFDSAEARTNNAP
jgi:hypothetical protein